jgi:very-short-patch-repair endonuclease
MSEIIPYIGDLRTYARSMRNDMTRAEKKLWYKIRCKQLHEVQFCRQMIIESYIIDFYAKIPKIAIEIDGPIHLSREAIDKDMNRDHSLRELGITVIRFTNHEVINKIDAVINTISRVILNNLPL